MRTIGIVVALLVASGSAPAQTVNCKAFERAIDDSLRNIAQLYIDGSRDDSAPRDTNRLLRTSHEWALIDLQVQLMAQNKCPPIKSPVIGYMRVAAVCVEKANDLGGSRSTVAECSQANWKRDE